MRHGLPQLCLPQGADQFLNGAAVGSSGAGISLIPNAATASAIHDAIRALLDRASYRETAVRLGRSIAAMPPPDEVAAVIERLARSTPGASTAR
jgi:UDP:flavonoid glycosyltransferase YjiC (YdhE family)